MPLADLQRTCAALSACCLTSLAAAGAPDETKAQCLTAYADGQRARNAGEFQRARELFAFCGGMSCPGALHGDCQRWLEEVEKRAPTAVFRVMSETGEELTGAHVTVGAGAKQELSGRALTFDPGEHELVFSAPGHRPVMQRFRFIEGEKLVKREVKLEPTARSPGGGASPPGGGASPPGGGASPPGDGASPPGAVGAAPLWPTWLGVGVGGLGAAGFVYFGLDARSEDRALDSCSPNCAPVRVKRVEQRYLLANISLGVGIAGFLGAATWLLLRPDADPPVAAGSGRTLSWYLGPETCGLRGSF